MASELKPCPFCGSNRIAFRSTPDMDTDGKFHSISCNECGAGSREKFAMETCPIFYEELRNAWNTRPTPARCDELVTTSSINGTLLVTRPNAEAVIAALTARIAELEEHFAEMTRSCLAERDRNKALEADNKRLREALEDISRGETTTYDEDVGTDVSTLLDEEEMQSIARAALEVKP